jgi:riboflavin kinase/FMN adenylyltransferase
VPAAAVSIGVFDGVHRGHRQLIARLREIADAQELRAVAVTFDPHPATVVRPDQVPKLLTGIELRSRLLIEAGADEVEVVAFTPELSRLTPVGFASRVLRERLGASHVVVGAHFRFGHRAAGDVGTLRDLGLQVEAVELVRDGEQGEVLSSTWVREQLAAGDVAAAARVLARPHALEGPVVRGEARGRELGYPTANVDVDPAMAVPADGVYAGRLVRAAGEALPAAISVGTNPTFDGRERTVEAYAIGVGHDLDLYDEHVAVEFTDRLRGQERFDTVDALVAQMDRDVAAARTALGYT